MNKYDVNNSKKELDPSLNTKQNNHIDEKLNISLNEAKQNRIKYFYSGPVYKFDNLYRQKWEGNTWAVSDKQALNQLTYQFKKQDGWVADTAFSLNPKYLTKDNSLTIKAKEEPLETKTNYSKIEYCKNCGTRLTDGGYCHVCDDGDEDALNEDIKMLDITTPYMLKNDGSLLKCGDIHPYIKMSRDSSNETNLKTLESHPEFLDWFEKADPDLHDLITEFKESKDIEEKYDLMNLLNNITNQEFCRVRTSNYKVPYGGNNGEIYFRISSDGFNWFSLIWNVVNKFSHQIKTVTVLNDRQSKGGGEFDYYYDHIPVDEFLTLKGNPLVENQTNCIYNKCEETDMKKKTQLTEDNEDIFADEEETEKDKEFNKKFGQYANKAMSFDDFFNLSQEMRKFYEQ